MMYKRKTEKILLTPFDHVMNLLGSKWNSRILSVIYKNGRLRYIDLKESLGGISDPVLSAALKQLSSEGIIIREQYNEVPLRVEYRLSDKGSGLVALCRCICHWGSMYYPPASEEDRLFTDNDNDNDRTGRE